MKTQTFTPSPKNAGALEGKSYPLSPEARLEETEIDIRSWVMRLMVSNSADKLNHTSGGIVLPCLWGPSREKTSLLEETLGSTLPEVLLTCWVTVAESGQTGLSAPRWEVSSPGRAKAQTAL